MVARESLRLLPGLTHALRGAVKVFSQFFTSLCQILDQRGATTMECLERGRLIVWGALLPTPREDTAPLAGQGAHSRLGRLALVALRLGGDLRPAGMSCGGRRPLPTRWSQALRPWETLGDPGLLAAAFRHGRKPRRCL